MHIEMFHKKARSCATCMHWESSLRKFASSRQHVMFVSNNKARCVTEGDYENMSTAASHKCRSWQGARRFRPIPSEFVEEFKKFERELAERQA